ncbi:zinc ribbon domain protein [Caudoviricetes sp.]|nr:zinc ribbon domain protein [Caudoviricetes sp.]
MNHDRHHVICRGYGHAYDGYTWRCNACGKILDSRYTEHFVKAACVWEDDHVSSAR